ncbi:MAG: hypothetical protein WA668_15385 [Candidatus Cybelea sp.]
MPNGSKRIGSAREEQRPEVVERVDEVDWDVGEAKDDHDRSDGSVDAVEQTIQREHDEDLDRRGK